MTRPTARPLPAARHPPGRSPLAAPTEKPPLVYTIAEAARLLRVPEGWLRKKVTAGAVPHTRLGKHVRFTAEHLRQIIAAGDRQPVSAPAPVTHGVSPRARRPRPVA